MTLLPSLTREISEIPIPTIEGEYYRRNLSYRISNLKIAFNDILPDRMKYKFNTDWDISLKSIAAPVMASYLDWELRDISSHLRDVEFEVRNRLIFFTELAKIHLDSQEEGDKI
jgi:hypothetical protein